MVTAFVAIFNLFMGTIALWIGIMFINGTLFMDGLSSVYERIPSPFWRMLSILPIMGVGHLLFSLAKKVDPVVAGPASIVFTVVPPILYSLWLLNTYPTPKIIIYVTAVVALVWLLGMELNSLQKSGQ